MSAFTTQMAWEWRKATGGVFVTLDHPGQPRRFHAYDVNDNAACKPMWGLIASCEEPNEGSDLCAECIEVVRAEPAGRPKRDANGSSGDHGR